MVDAGTLTKRFDVQSPTRTQNDFGEVTITYSQEAMRWGSIRATSARDRLNASQVSSEVSHQVVMRKGGIDIKPDWRLVLGARSFRVVEVFDPDDGSDQWTLEVAEVVGV